MHKTDMYPHENFPKNWPQSSQKEEIKHFLHKLPQIRGNSPFGRGRNDGCGGGWRGARITGVIKCGKQGVATPCYWRLATCYFPPARTRSERSAKLAEVVMAPTEMASTPVRA